MSLINKIIFALLLLIFSLYQVGIGFGDNIGVGMEEVLNLV
jgi:hypothetical protein